MKHDEGDLGSSAGASLYYQRWRPSAQPKAILIVVHGLAEHSGRYQHFARFFTEQNFAVYALDLAGHGKSSGERCDIGSFSEFTDGVGLLLEKAREEIPQAPLVLVGHSMGGLIAIYFLINRQSELNACVLSGAAVQPAERISWVQSLLMRFFSRVLPKLRLLQLDASKVSRDPVVVDRYRTDPLVFTGKVTVRLAEQLLSAMGQIEGKLGAIGLPTLILHGSRDGLTSPEGSKMLHEKIGSRDKKLIIYDGLYHEIYNEPEQDAVMNDVAEWLAVHLETPGSN